MGLTKKQDLKKIREWANSPKGIQAMKDAIDWANKRAKERKKRERVSSARMNKYVY